MMSTLSFTALGQGGNIVGGLNQIEKDPAQKGFEKEYEELGNVLDDLDEPQKQVEKRKRTTPDRNSMQSEPYENRVNDQDPIW